jgi:lysophospholipase L1-like esterase
MPWSTAYLAALSGAEDVPPRFPLPRSFADETVRQRVRLGRGGSAVRLVLSNEYGRKPLILDEVNLGPDRHPALLDGARRWEIPAGESAASDPVPWAVGAGDELVVTVHVTDETGPATYLHSAQQTGEVAGGNQCARAHLAGPELFVAAYWIAQVLVDAPSAGPVIVALGDSITRGDGTSIDRDQRYPNHLQRRLLAAGVDSAVVLNAGIGGNGVVRGVFGPPMTDRFDRDVLTVAGVTHVLIMGGLNDISLDDPSHAGARPAPATLVGALLSLAGRARERGVRPVLGTITPAGGSPYEPFWAEGVEATRRAVNQALRARSDIPVVDFAAALADPTDPSRLDTRYDSGDGVHPSDAGHAAMAGAVDLTLFQTGLSTEDRQPG